MIQVDAEEKEGCKALPSFLFNSGDLLCPKWGVSPVDVLGERQLREVFSPMDEVLMSEAMRFQDTMSISFSKAGGRGGGLSSTPFRGAIMEARREVGFICLGDLSLMDREDSPMVEDVRNGRMG